MKVVADLARDDPRIDKISRIAYDAQTGIVKSMVAGTSSSVEGIKLTPEVAESLTRNTRRKSNDVRLDGVYRLLKIDWSDPLKFKVKVFNTKTGLQIDAEVQDESLNGKYKEALREAEWSRSPVMLKINAIVFGEDEYREAIVISAEKYEGADPAA